MRGLVLLVVVVGVVAGQDQPQLNEGEQQFQKAAEPQPPQQQFYYTQPGHYAAGYNSYAENRNGVGARHGFFDIAGTYASGLVTTFLFVVGVILLLDLMFGDINIVETIMGRSGKSLWDKGSEMMGALDTINLIESANEVYTALEKYQQMNLPRSF